MDIDTKNWPIREISPESLLSEARKALVVSYAPYSRFRVGAAVLGENGAVASGGNIENASYSVSLCAERNALSSFISQSGEKPVAIAIATDSGAPCYPCGVCLQFLHEFNPDILVVLESDREVLVYSLRELLPHPFNLKNESL